MDSSSLSAYRFERLGPLHYLLLQKLFFNVYHIHLSTDDLEKRFNTSLLGKEVIGFIAIHKTTGEPAAYYGVFPMKVLFENKMLSIGQAGDLMVDPSHRMKNLFIELAKKTHRVCKEEGMKMVISQPNESSFHGFVSRLGFIVKDEIIRWDLKLDIKTVPLSKLVHRINFFKKIYSVYANQVLKKYNIPPPSLFNNPLPVSIGKVVRDESYINYKKSADRFFIKINNCILWIRLTDVFWIGDFENYETINYSVIKKIKQLSFLLGYNTISLNMNSSIRIPETLGGFKKYSSQPSCFLYLDEMYKDVNLVLAAADSDTW